jgi:hypothetical protein
MRRIESRMQRCDWGLVDDGRGFSGYYKGSEAASEPYGLYGPVKDVPQGLKAEGFAWFMYGLKSLRKN